MPSWVVAGSVWTRAVVSRGLGLDGETVRVTDAEVIGDDDGDLGPQLMADPPHPQLAHVHDPVHLVQGAFGGVDQGGINRVHQAAEHFPDPYREVLRKLAEPARREGGWSGWRIPDRAAVFRARKNPRGAPLRELLAQVGHGVTDEATPGVFWRGLWLMTLDGTTLEVADTAASEGTLGRPTARTDGPSTNCQDLWIG